MSQAATSLLMVVMLVVFLVLVYKIIKDFLF